MRKLSFPFLAALGRKARSAAPADSTPLTPKSDLFAIVTAVLIAVLVGGSLWISINGLIEKVRLSHQLQQVIDIVSMAHDSALAGRLDPNNQEDLLAALGRLGNLTPTGEINGIKTLSNPWGGIVAASTVAGGKFFRLETVAPADKCRRLIDLFDQNRGALNLEQIETKDREGNWQYIYAENGNTKPGNTKLAANCNNPVQADIILTFSLK
jgi:hypothetical protein